MKLDLFAQDAAASNFGNIVAAPIAMTMILAILLTNAKNADCGMMVGKIND